MITLDEADRAIRAARAKAEEMGLKVSIAVVDRRGDLVALARMDGAGYFSHEVARGKALASALSGRPSGTMKDAAGPIIELMERMMSGTGTMIRWQGAVGISRNGEHVGAIGVSGASSEDDEKIAVAGASAAAG